MKKQIILLTFLFLSSKLLAGDYKADTTQIASLIAEIKNKYVPDTREAVYNISVSFRNDSILYRGVTTNRDAVNEILSRTKTHGDFAISNQIRLLPDRKLGDTLYAVINVSVADIRTQNRFTSGMATQSLLGTPVKLLEKDGWYRIQMPDTYIGWAHEKQIVPMNKKEYNKWIMAPKIIFTKHYGFSYEEPNSDGAIVSDLVAGDVLKFLSIKGDYFKVMYPDKREAYVLRKETQEHAIWLQSRKPSKESFVNMAQSMTGIPYVWGGTSTKGMDCSGLVSTVMSLHGLTILRDASQQANVGEEIDITNGYQNLEVGDLMFFGKEDNIRHVGFYLGDLKFIHASGWTRVSSLNPKDKDYDELNTKEFVKATRIISDKGDLQGVDKLKNNSFYHIQK